MEGIKNYLSDMDGVILRGTTLIPGAAEFVHRLLTEGIPFLILTNDSKYGPACTQSPFRGFRDDRRSHGYRYHCRDREWLAHNSRSHRSHLARERRSFPLPSNMDT